MGTTKKMTWTQRMAWQMKSPSSKNSVTLSTAIIGAVKERFKQFEILRLTMKIFTDLSRSLFDDKITKARKKLPTSPRLTIRDIEITFTKNVVSVL